MTIDRQKLWSIVAQTRETFHESAPEGYGAIVEVTLAGRSGPLVVHRAETPTNPDLPWTVFSIYSAKDAAAPGENDSRILVHDDHIQGIEVRFARTTVEPIAFTFGELADGG
jgi:hypothetical protein